MFHFSLRSTQLTLPFLMGKFMRSASYGIPIKVTIRNAVVKEAPSGNLVPRASCLFDMKKEALGTSMSKALNVPPRPRHEYTTLSDSEYELKSTPYSSVLRLVLSFMAIQFLIRANTEYFSVRIQWSFNAVDRVKQLALTLYPAYLLQPTI